MNTTVVQSAGLYDMSEADGHDTDTTSAEIYRSVVMEQDLEIHRDTGFYRVLIISCGGVTYY